MHAYTQDSLIELLLKKQLQELGSQKALAKKLGISPQYLNDILNCRREPGKKILSQLGLKKTTLYVKENANV